jgi:O-methyltransferase
MVSRNMHTVLKNIVKNVAAHFGYEMRAISYPRSASPDVFDAAVAMVGAFTMLPRDRLVSLYDQVAQCEKAGVAGAFVECGVWKGGSVGLMALASRNINKSTPRDLHLFDSFQDICEPNPDVDGSLAIKEIGYIPEPANGHIKPVKGFYDGVGGHGTLADCKALLESRVRYPVNRLHYHVGWFQDVLPLDQGDIGPIAILRLDGDWYASTKVCLDYLYDQVVPGGFVIVDDYGVYEGCKRAVDEFMQVRGICAYLHRVDQACYYFVKP